MTIKRVNNLLLLTIVVVNLYVVLLPLLPQLVFHISHTQGKVQQLQAKVLAAPVKQAMPGKQPQPYELIVPSMALDTQIYEAPKREMYRVLDKGIWHWPDSSTPDKGGNTVLLGHRFTYVDPRGVLYFLNKVSVNDSIGLAWSGHKYIYKVTQVSIVPPSDTSVITPTVRPTLTIYTCTPLWKPHDRLVVTAELEQIL